MSDNKENKKKSKGTKGAGRFKKSDFVNTTPPGQLKDFNEPMHDTYEPVRVEAAWDAWWEAQGLYKPDPLDEEKEKFVIVIPPPNVTGTLHLGHALTCSIEDCLVRYHRMCGKNVLWVPGCDHAGIATQVVVEKKLMREEKKTRHDLGREEFIKRVWQWKEKNGDRIYTQIRRLGASVDWSREAFTMNPMLCAAVQEAFIRMHKKGLIYRANRLVNWSCELRTAISAIEVEKIELEGPTMRRVPGHDEEVEFGVIHSFAYKFKETGDEIIVATTRIETMLGDVAVAVHPDDPRYTKYHGKKILHPFIEGRELDLITDEKLVDMNFGTGAVKITPAHDPNDFECGKRHSLEMINILNPDGTINENGGKYQGQKRFVVRSKIIEDLKALELYRGKASNPMALGICSRSKDVVEPVLRPQWWVNCEDLAARAVQAVRGEELKIMPKSHEKTWYNWLENIRDWCISRQLWWGHRIPAYHISVDGQELKDTEDNWIVAENEDKALEEAKKRFPGKEVTVAQDPDVLDTWFSSGLFPFSTMGWPNQTDDLKAFYPGALLETGHDILFFWVARMVMMGLCLMDDLPFKEVYLHAMVRDKFGRKMSKSLGNVVDPIDVIEGITLEALNEKLRNSNLDPREVEKAIEGQKEDYKDGIAECGTDSLRFGLLAYSAQGRDINLDILRVVSFREFGNKLWNATKFGLRNFPDDFKRPTWSETMADAKQHGSLPDLWILSRLAYCVEAVNKGFAEYSFADCTTALYNFWKYQLCDVYLEAIKPVMYNDDEDPAKKAATLSTLYSCLDLGLRLLHPFMCFLTEELWHRLPGQPRPDNHPTGSIMVEKYPTVEETKDMYNAGLESDMEVVQELAHAIRSLRSNFDVPNQARPDIVVVTDQKHSEGVLRMSDDLKVLSYSGSVGVLTKEQAEGKDADKLNGCGSVVVSTETSIYMKLSGLVNLSKELLKKNKKLTQLNTAIAALENIISGPGFQNMPADKQAATQAKLDTQKGQRDAITSAATDLEGLMSPQDKGDFYQSLIKQWEGEKKKLEKNIKKLTPKPGKELNKRKQKQLDAALHNKESLDKQIAETESLLAALNL